MSYSEDLKIDETSLDLEWLDQANLAMKYGKRFAFAKKRLTEADEKVKVIKAELISEANTNPMKCCKKDKPNAADIEAYYRTHRRHKEAKEEWITAQFECDMAEIAKNEVSFTRKAALEQLVTLYMGNYFAGPKVPRDLTWERDQKSKKVNSRISARLNRKK